MVATIVVVVPAMRRRERRRSRPKVAAIETADG